MTPMGYPSYKSKAKNRWISGCNIYLSSITIRSLGKVIHMVRNMYIDEGNLYMRISVVNIIILQSVHRPRLPSILATALLVV